MSLRLKRALVVAVGATVCLVMLVLGLWQMQVFQGQGRQSAEERAMLPPLTLSQATQGSDVGESFGRRLRLTGHFLDEPDLYAGTTYPLRVVSPFRTDEGHVVAVVRGLRAAPSPVAAPPRGELTLVGVVLPSENDTRTDLPAQDLPARTLASVRLPTIAQQWPSPLLNGYVTLDASSAEAAGGLRPAPVTLPRAEGRARNGGYALQWWVFAASALAFSIVAARSMKEPDEDVALARDPARPHSAP